MDNDERQRDLRETFDLYELLQQIKKYFWMILLGTCLAGMAGYFGSEFLIEPQYESAITMIVNTKQGDTKTVTNDNITSAQNLVSTYSVIVKSNTVLNQVIEELNLDLTYSELEENVFVNAVDDTQIMRVAVRNSDRNLSADIVNEIAVIAPDVIVDTVEAGSCKVISQVMTEKNPVTPNIPKNTLLAAVAGFMVVIISIAIGTVFKVKKIVDDNDVQKLMELPVLGVIPEIEGAK